MKVRIDPPVAKRLKAAAKKNRRSASKEATEIIDKALVDVPTLPVLPDDLQINPKYFRDQIIKNARPKK